MGKITILVLLLLVGLSFADSDITGIYAGTTERMIFGLPNSTGVFETNANCSIRILFNSVAIVNYTNMTNMGEGLYYYDWSVPQDIGTYNLFVNCTNPANESKVGGGSVYVVARSFEKSVANGVAKYGEQASVKYGTDWWGEPLKWIGAVGLALGVVLVLYIASKR